jgi:hypothetical protein
MRQRTACVLGLGRNSASVQAVHVSKLDKIDRSGHTRGSTESMQHISAYRCADAMPLLKGGVPSEIEFFIKE